jgi:hypothetical protein
MDRRGFGAPFEYEYHFIEYEYERAFLTALIPGEPENKKSPGAAPHYLQRRTHDRFGAPIF